MEEIKSTIDANITPNGEQGITGSVLNRVLNDMVDATGAKLARLDQEFQAIKDAEFTVTPHIERVAMTETIAELQPDRFYVWEQPVESLVISKLIPADAKFVSRYQFEFVCPDNAPTALSMPVGIVWNEQPILKAGKTYQVSVTDNLAIINTEAELETILEDYVTEDKLNAAIESAITTTLNTEV